MTVPAVTEGELGEQLSTMRALLGLGMALTESTDEGQILRLATTAVPSLAPCRVAGVHIEGRWRLVAPPCTRPAVRRDLEAMLRSVDGAGKQLPIEGEGWMWAFPLRCVGGQFGHVIVRAEWPPSNTEEFLLQALVQQIGATLGNARLQARERATAERLKEARLALESRMEIHQRLTRVAVGGEGQDGIARAIHELTGYPVAIEDCFGNLRAWAGPDRPEPYPKVSPARREQTLRRAMQEGTTIRDADRVVALARPRDDTIGVLALIDPTGTAGSRELVALEHGATVLAMELARSHSLAETELRIRRDLVAELLAGTDEESALARARSLGYDLGRPHRVLVAEGQYSRGQDWFFHAVRRMAQDHGVGSLIASRGESVVLLADSNAAWERLREAIMLELGGGACRIGVGSVCHGPSDYPRSYREAQLALKMQQKSGGSPAATVFDDLGVYRVLGELSDIAAVPAMERFVHDWLGPLIDYDRQKKSNLTLTLCRYFECGGNYDLTAEALGVGRSTFKYRLRRIRELLGHDLSDPETNFTVQFATRAWQTLQALRA
jgi:DNA-binding PucR family transcriptional regulator